jgi:hypothetical protein
MRNRPHPSPMPLLLGVSLLVAAGITLGRVRMDEHGRLGSGGGYTWSLGLWFLPIAVLLVWFIRRRDQVIQRPAFWTTLVVLIAAGFALDYFFAHSFFLFPNTAATLLPPAPARGGPVPSEEYLFYVGGFLFVLLLYIWCDEDFLLLYNVPDYQEEWAKTGRTRVAEFDPFSLTGAAVLIAAAWIYKAAVAQGPYRGGFPGYLAYLTILGVAPGVGFLKATRRFINWRAFALTFQVVVAISLLWEATLAVPLGWWRYQPGRMTGVVVEAWHDLPLEAVLLWLAVTFTTVVIYEAVKVWQASGGKMPAFIPRRVRASVRKWYHLPD